MLAERSASICHSRSRHSSSARPQSRSSLAISTERYCWLVRGRSNRRRINHQHEHSALKLTVTRLPLMFAGTAPFLYRVPRAVLAVLTGTAALIWLSSYLITEPGVRAFGCQISLSAYAFAL